MSSIIESLKSQTGIWFVGAVITVLTIFSSQLSEKIKLHLNKADLRTKQYEELAVEISSFIFSAELSVEFIENEWTTKETLAWLISDYNESLTMLRKKEYVYLAWLKKYWGDEELKNFDGFMKSLKIFDYSIHTLNDEFEAVLYKEKEKVDSKVSSIAIENMKSELSKLRDNGRILLEAL